MSLEVTCIHQCRAAVGCVSMESCTFSAAITPGGTQTGYFFFFVCCIKEVLCHPLSAKKEKTFQWTARFETLLSGLYSVDLPPAPEGSQSCVGGNEGS